MIGLKITDSAENLKRKQIDIYIEEKSADLNTAIPELITQITILSKEQLLDYFWEFDRTAVCSSIKRLISKKALFQIPDEIQHNLGEKYITDPRLIDPDYFVVKKQAGKENTYGNLERFRIQIENLQHHYQAFWIYLDFKKQANAANPFSINSQEYPFIILGFFMDNDVWEILYVKQGLESSLLILATKEKYASENSITNRIVIVEDEIQINLIKKYNLSGIRCFAVMKDDGNTEYKS